MIDAVKYMAFLKKHQLSSEQFFLMYRLMILEPTHPLGQFKVKGRDDKDSLLLFSQMSNEYQEWARIDNNPIDWIAVANVLEERGYVEIWARTDDEIKLTNIKITEKFKGEFAVNDIEEAVTQLIDVYPKMVVIQKGGMKYPAMNMPLDKLAILYAEKILKGNSILLHQRCLAITEQYIDDLGTTTAPMSLEKYFEQFDGIARAYENGEGSSQEDDDDAI